MNELRAALAKLDIANENHWTADGLPRLETVRLLVGNSSLSREAVTQAAPGFSRANPDLSGAVAPAAPAPAEGEPETAPDADGQELDPDNSLEAGSNGESEGDTRGPDDETEPGAAEAAYEAARKALDAAERTKEQALKAVKDAQEAVDRLVEARTASTPRHAGQLTVQAYLASQTAQRLARAARASAQPTDPRSQMDRAFARRTARGTTRPKAL